MLWISLLTARMTQETAIAAINKRFGASQQVAHLRPQFAVRVPRLIDPHFAEQDLGNLPLRGALPSPVERLQAAHMHDGVAQRRKQRTARKRGFNRVELCAVALHGAPSIPDLDPGKDDVRVAVTLTQPYIECETQRRRKGICGEQHSPANVQELLATRERPDTEGLGGTGFVYCSEGHQRIRGGLPRELGVARISLRIFKPRQPPPRSRRGAPTCVG